MRTFQIAASVFLPLFFGGCAVPPVFMATTSMGDSASYRGTGKSMADWALSEVLESDCTVMHGFTRGDFCRDSPEFALVNSPSSQMDADAVALTEQTEEMVADASFSKLEKTSATPETSQPETSVPRVAPSTTTEPRWAFVLGVFAQYEQAATLAKKLKPRPAIVSSVIVRGEVFYRVTTRPFKLDEAPENEKQVAAIGFPDVQMAAVCPRWMQDKTCLVLDRFFAL